MTAVSERPWSVGGCNQHRGFQVTTTVDFNRIVGGGPSVKHVMWAPTAADAERIVREHNAALPEAVS